MEISIMLKEKYEDLFHISDGDYEKSATYYNEYLEIFHDLVQGDTFDDDNLDNLQERIKKSNPWKKYGYSDGKYEFISLAGTDCDILAPLLIDNIEPWLSEAQPNEPLNVFIGSENPIGKSSGATLIISKFRSQFSDDSYIGVIGPTRQNYRRTMELVRRTGAMLEEVL